MIIITTSASERMNIMISKNMKRYEYDDLEEKFKIINEKFDDSDFLNNGEDLKFESNINIGFSKKSSHNL